MQSMHIKFILL